MKSHGSWPVLVAGSRWKRASAARAGGASRRCGRAGCRGRALSPRGPCRACRNEATEAFAVGRRRADGRCRSPPSGRRPSPGDRPLAHSVLTGSRLGVLHRLAKRALASDSRGRLIGFRCSMARGSLVLQAPSSTTTMGSVSPSGRGVSERGLWGCCKRLAIHAVTPWRDGTERPSARRSPRKAHAAAAPRSGGAIRAVFVARSPAAAGWRASARSIERDTR